MPPGTVSVTPPVINSLYALTVMCAINPALFLIAAQAIVGTILTEAVGLPEVVVVVG